MSNKTTLAVTPGSGANLNYEQETSDSSVTPIHFIYEGRLIPVAGAATSDNVVSATTSASADLLTHKPTGANFLRVHLASTETGYLRWWDCGLNPGSVTPAPTITAGNYYDFPNIGELSTLRVIAVTAAVNVICLWYKTK